MCDVSEIVINYGNRPSIQLSGDQLRVASCRVTLPELQLETRQLVTRSRFSTLSGMLIFYQWKCYITKVVFKSSSMAFEQAHLHLVQAFFAVGKHDQGVIGQYYGRAVGHQVLAVAFYHGDDGVLGKI